MSVVQ